MLKNAVKTLALAAALLFASPALADCGGSTAADYFQDAKLVAQAEHFLASLKQAVAKNDRAAIASEVKYPLTVFRTKGRSVIRNAAKFKKKYGSIITGGVQQAILEQDPKCLFANSQGIMIGDGQVWFELTNGGGAQIITINASGS